MRVAFMCDLTYRRGVHPREALKGNMSQSERPERWQLVPRAKSGTALEHKELNVSVYQ
jgi:hypothetical protein